MGHFHYKPSSYGGILHLINHYEPLLPIINNILPTINHLLPIINRGFHHGCPKKMREIRRFSRIFQASQKIQPPRGIWPTLVVLR